VRFNGGERLAIIRQGEKGVRVRTASRMAPLLNPAIRRVNLNLVHWGKKKGQPKKNPAKKSSAQTGGRGIEKFRTLTGGFGKKSMPPGGNAISLKWSKYKGWEEVMKNFNEVCKNGTEALDQRGMEGEQTGDRFSKAEKHFP